MSESNEKDLPTNSGDLLYLDYFNGMSNWHNPNTLSLYLTNATYNKKTNQTVYICSAPFTDQLSYSISHSYDTSSAGLVGEILKRFHEGVKDGAMFAGSAMMLVKQLGDLTGIKSLQGLTTSRKYQAIMNQMLATGNIDVVMPWEETLTFKRTKNSITLPTIKFQIASSSTLGEWLEDKINNNSMLKQIGTDLQYAYELAQEIEGTLKAQREAVGVRWHCRAA